MCPHARVLSFSEETMKHPLGVSRPGGSGKHHRALGHLSGYPVPSSPSQPPAASLQAPRHLATRPGPPAGREEGLRGHTPAAGPPSPAVVQILLTLEMLVRGSRIRKLNDREPRKLSLGLSELSVVEAPEWASAAWARQSPGPRRPRLKHPEQRKPSTARHTSRLRKE